MRNNPENEDVWMMMAEVPPAERFGYASTLRSLTLSRANQSMEPEHIASVPAEVHVNFSNN